QIALVHQVDTNFAPVAVLEKNVIQHDDGRPGLAVGFKSPVDVLQEIELFVGGGEGEVVPGGPFPALFGAEGGIGQDYVHIHHFFAQVGKGVPQENFPLQAVEHRIHKGQSVSVLHKFAAGKGFFNLKA